MIVIEHQPKRVESRFTRNSRLPITGVREARSITRSSSRGRSTCFSICAKWPISPSTSPGKISSLRAHTPMISAASRSSPTVSGWPGAPGCHRCSSRRDAHLRRGSRSARPGWPKRRERNRRELPTLVSSAVLAGHLDDPGWRVFDCRHLLTILRPVAGPTPPGICRGPASCISIATCRDR
jgi:hypothetical protein